MKTISKTHKILSLTAIASLFVIFNMSAAQPVQQTEVSTIAGLHYALPGNPLSTASHSEKSTVAEMFSNARYWVDYLRSTLSVDNEELSFSTEATNEVRKMESSPDYWPEALKSIIGNEDSAVNSIMETDPEYWMHYLQSAIAEENAKI